MAASFTSVSKEDGVAQTPCSACPSTHMPQARVSQAVCQEGFLEEVTSLTGLDREASAQGYKVISARCRLGTPVNLSLLICQRQQQKTVLRGVCGG